MTPAPDLAKRILRAARLAEPIYVAHDWKWGRDSKKEVPTVEQIADTIKRLYDIAVTNESGCCSSGRLSVYVDAEDGEIGVDVQLAELRDPTS